MSNDRRPNATQLSHHGSVTHPLLSLCALLSWFDLPLLQFLGSVEEAELSHLLHSNLIIPNRYPEGSYRLHPDRADEILARMREAEPHLELTLHEAAFNGFAALSSSIDGPRRRAVEEAAFYHLDKVFYLLIPHEDWARIEAHLDTARGIPVTHTPHQQRLAFYDCYLALNRADYREAEGLLRVLLDDPTLEPALQTRSMNALALCYMYQARFDLALAWYQRTYEKAREIHDLHYQGAALINMGMVYHDLSQYEQALSLTQQSLALFRQKGDQATEVYALYEIANCALHLGRWQVAREHLQQAAVLAEALKLSSRLVNIYWAQGLLYHLMGQPAESERAYLRGLSLARSSARETIIPISDTLWYLGFLYHTEGRDGEALAAYEEALALNEAFQRAHALSLVHFHCGELFRRQGKRSEARAAYEQAIQAIEGLRADTDGTEVKLGLLGTTQHLYEAMVHLCVEEGRLEQAFAYVERARSQAFLDQLRQKDADLYNALDQPAASLAEVQAVLPDGALLLEYFTTGIVPPGENIVNTLPPNNARLRDYLVQPPCLFLFAVTRQDWRFHSLALDPNLLQPKLGSISPVRRLLQPRQLAYLYTQLLAPVQSLLDAHDLLYLVPHGPLHYVPWMALRAPNGTYLLDEDGPAIALAPSATVLLRASRQREASAPDSFLALGYNDEGEDALRYAESEARLLARLMDGDAWVGDEPKQERLIARARELGWLHISGHGIFHPHSPLDSQLRLGRDDSPTARDIIRDLSLTVKLVSLSACTSGLNHIVPGDELLGLPRAFLYAGAPTVVCTPWEAPDLVALLVMERFYRDLRCGKPPAHALRDAQVAIRTMTGRDLLATLRRWHDTYPTESRDIPLPTLTAEQMDQPLFADPSYWALFMLIGSA